MVSIIIPIYKVEKYINRCINSILSQTYTNIEVLLVDDGSPDNCGTICDEYAMKDNRVRVIHKNNGGISSARNQGMNYVNGEYVLFVDSDDWLQERAVELLINTMLKYNADVVQGAFYYAYNDYLLIDERYYNDSTPPIVLDNNSLMSELIINERVKNFAWGKLYKTDIISNTPFKLGVLFEDVFWAHKVMQRVNNYVIINQPIYFYFQRNDSIVSSYSFRHLDIIKGLKERHLFIEQNYANLVEKSYMTILKTSFIQYNLLILNKKEDNKGLYKKEIQQYILENYDKLKKAAKGDTQLSKQLFLFKIHPALNNLILILNKILRKLKIISQPIGLRRIDI